MKGWGGLTSQVRAGVKAGQELRLDDAANAGDKT